MNGLMKGLTYSGVFPQREGGQLPVCHRAQRPHPHPPGRTDPLHTQVREKERYKYTCTTRDT